MTPTQNLQLIVKRNGAEVPFDKKRIFNAIEKAFLSENKLDLIAAATVTEEVVSSLEKQISPDETPNVEQVQDLVEETLMKNGYHRIAKNYILYREKHKKAREEAVLTQIKQKSLEVVLDNNQTEIFDSKPIKKKLQRLTTGLKRIGIKDIIETVSKQIYNKITLKEINLLVLGAVREQIEDHYDYAYLASRWVLNELYKNVLDVGFNEPEFETAYQDRFAAYIERAIQEEMLNPELAKYDLQKIAQAIQPDRDKLFMYQGIQIVMDRYLLRDRTEDKAVFELPQWFWMRVAMGLALKEPNREQHAIDFYTVLSKMDLVSSTPTLFNSGTLHSQMSSCYINIVDDSLQGIFKVFADNASLSKWAGGIGTDWTNIRATGSKIKGTNGESQGVIPFIKIFNDVALAVNQGGKRKGAMCAYMEVWHLDFEQFIELKKNTGDERRRAHDINTACWIPDLFMKRVQQGGKWTLFCPSQTPELHDLYGEAFEAKYLAYEKQNLSRSKTVPAQELWRKMLTMLFETGHPWLTFKDAINVRSPQDHVGVVHSSNLCTEITLNTSPDETAVCNLASVNIAQFIKDGQIDQKRLGETIEIGIRMLDNVIDNNYYPTKEAKTANLRHRAIGLGMMGYQDALHQLKIGFDTDECLEFADRSMEMVSYYAILASSKLAAERGTYETYDGSKWDRGILPYDTLSLLENERGHTLKVSKAMRMDWAPVRASIKKHGMRNSNTMAIAPTATIANIAGVFPCTEPAYKNIYMKENLSGNFLVINRYLIDELDAVGLWNADMLQHIKANNGSVSTLTQIPESIRNRYKEVFEIDQEWIVKAAALRAKWIDQSASTNIFLHTTSGKVISDIYMLAWEHGLKTTYYLRTLGASQISKMAAEVPAEKPEPVEVDTKPVVVAEPQACLINDPSCEVCQ